MEVPEGHEDYYGQSFSDFIITLKLKIDDLEHDTFQDKMRINKLESDISMMESEMNNQKLFNSQISEIINYSVNAEMFYTMTYNYTKKMSGIVDAPMLLTNAAYVSSTLHYAYQYNNDSYSLDFWSLLFERAIEMGVSRDILNNNLKSYYKMLTNSSSTSGISGYNLIKNRPQLAAHLQREYNYYQICSKFMSNEREENIEAKVVLESLCDYYRREYVRYIFKQWDTKTVIKHWSCLKFTGCGVYQDEYTKNMYNSIINKNDRHHTSFESEHVFVKTIRNDSPRIDNYFKLKNQ